MRPKSPTASVDMMEGAEQRGRRWQGGAVGGVSLRRPGAQEVRQLGWDGKVRWRGQEVGRQQISSFACVPNRKSLESVVAWASRRVLGGALQCIP